MRTRVLVLGLLLCGVGVSAQEPTRDQRLAAQIRELIVLLEQIADTLAGSPGPIEHPTLHVPAGGDLAATVAKAPAGAIITVEAGATYTGTVTLPLKACAPVTTITTAGVTLTRGVRVDPSWAGRLAVVRSGSVAPAVRMAEGTCGWALRGIQFEPNERGQHEVIEIGQAWDTKTVAGLPRDIFLSHVLMAFAGPQKRGIGMNGINVVVEDSHIASPWVNGQDSQALAAWNTPGPLTILRNHLEAGSEVILLGGADPGITNIVPADVTIEGNTLTRPASWRGDTTKQVKNLFEIKAGLRVTLRDNLLENHWPAAQSGWSIVLTPRSQSGRCTECRIEDVLIEKNILRNVSGGFNIIDTDNVNPSGVTQRVTIRDNLIQIDHQAWGGTGRFLLLQGAVADLHIEHNTIEQTGNQVFAGYGAPAPGFRFIGNLVKTTGTYGIFSTGADGQNHAHGLRWQEKYPDGAIEGNAFAGWRGSATSRANLPGNLFVSVEDATIEDGRGAGAVAGYGRR